MIDVNAQLVLHAQRVLTDGLPHDVHARAWARETLELNPASPDVCLPPAIGRLARAVETGHSASMKRVLRERFQPLSRSEWAVGVWR